MTTGAPIPEGFELVEDERSLTPAQYTTAAAPARGAAAIIPDGFELVTEPTTSALEAFGRAALDTGTFGFANRWQDRQRLEAGRKEHPWASFAGDAAAIVGQGAILGPAANAARAAQAAGNLGRVGSVAAKTALAAEKVLLPNPATATLGQAALTGAKVGATNTGLHAFGSTVTDPNAGWGDVAQQTIGKGALGAVAGGVLGPVAYKIGEGIALSRAARNEMANADTASLAAIDRALARDRIDPSTLRGQIEVPQYGKLTSPQISDVVRRMEAGESAAAIAGDVGVSAKAVSDAARRFQEQNATPLNLVDRAKLTGAAGGENTSWTLRAAMASPGEGRAIGASRLTDRQLEQHDRVVDAIGRMVSSADPQAKLALLKEGERLAYQMADRSAQPFDVGRVLAQWDQRGGVPNSEISKALEQAVALFRGSTRVAGDDVERAVMRPMLTPVRDAQGNITAYQRTMLPVQDEAGRPVTQIIKSADVDRVSPVSTLGDFQRAKRDLDQMIERSMNGYRPTPLTRELQRFKNDLMDEVGRTNPLWREANDFFAENRAAERLLGVGEKQSLRLTPESRREVESIAELHKTVASRKATPEAKAIAQAKLEMYRDGLAQALAARVLNKAQTGDHVGELLTPSARFILTSVMGRPRAAEFIRYLEKEAATTRTYRGLGGSQTTPLREAIDELNGPAMLASAVDWMNPRAVARALVAKGAARLSESRNNRMIPMMVEENPVRQLDLLRDLDTMRAARVAGGQAGMNPGYVAGNAFLAPFTSDASNRIRRERLP